MIDWEQETIRPGLVVEISGKYYLVGAWHEDGFLLKLVTDNADTVRSFFYDIDFLYENATIASEQAQILYGFLRK